VRSRLLLGLRIRRAPARTAGGLIPFGAFAAGRVPGVPMRLAGLDPVVDGGLETPRTARGRGFL